MKRQIINIDENKCNGCGLCVPTCPEGALQVIDGKARLVGELLCDGLGACIGNCPEGAITIEEREAQKYDERKVLDNVVKAGKAVIDAHLKHLKDHGQGEYLDQALAYLKEKNISIPATEKRMPPQATGGCPGMAMRDFRRDRDSSGQKENEFSGKSEKSQLRQWPIQLHLLSPQAPYFQDADLLVAADCTAFAFADFHQRFLKGKAMLMFCPKLDSAMDMYLEKLTQIIKENSIKSLTVVKMEVPCCSGSLRLAEEAVKRSGKNIVIKEYTISIQGEIQ